MTVPIEKQDKAYLSIILVLLIIGLLTSTYYQTFATLITQWNTNPDYSHGFFIPFIFLYMIWHVQKEKAFSALQPTDWGLLPLAVGVAIQTVSLVGSEHFLQGISLLIVLWSLSLYLGGWRIAKSLSMPIGYLIFMIPLPAIIWNKFSLLLKLQASNIASFLLIHITNIPFIQEGNLFHLSRGTLEVADACSGLRSLISLLAMGALIAFISKIALWKRLTLVIATIPIAIATNVLRLITLVDLANRYGIGVADSFLHTFSGIVVFVIGLALLLGINSMLRLHWKQIL